MVGYVLVIYIRITITMCHYVYVVYMLCIYQLSIICMLTILCIVVFMLFVLSVYRCVCFFRGEIDQQHESQSQSHDSQVNER